MAYAISLWAPPALEIVGSGDTFPVRRIFCVGRNYVEHQKEMGGDGREQPFFFLKSEFALVPNGGTVHFPAKTTNYHYETEMAYGFCSYNFFTLRAMSQFVSRGKKRLNRRSLRASRPSTTSRLFFRIASRMPAATSSGIIPSRYRMSARPSFRNRFLS